MKTSVIEVHDMLSVWSVDEVEERIGKVPGVESVTVNYTTGSATVRYDETRLEMADIKSAVRQSEYQSAGESEPKHESEQSPARKRAAVPTPEAAPASASTPEATVPTASTVAPAAVPAPAAPLIDGHKVAINALMLKRTKLAGIKSARSPSAPAADAQVSSGATA